MSNYQPLHYSYFLAPTLNRDRDLLTNNIIINFKQIVYLLCKISILIKYLQVIVPMEVSLLVIWPHGQNGVEAISKYVASKHLSDKKYLYK